MDLFFVFALCPWNSTNRLDLHTCKAVVVTVSVECENNWKFTAVVSSNLKQS